MTRGSGCVYVDRSVAAGGRTNQRALGLQVAIETGALPAPDTSDAWWATLAWKPTLYPFSYETPVEQDRQGRSVGRRQRPPAPDPFLDLILKLYKRGIFPSEALYLFRIREAAAGKSRDVTDPWVSRDFAKSLAGRPTYKTIAQLTLYWRNDAEGELLRAEERQAVHPAYKAAEVQNRRAYLEAWDKLLGGPSWLDLTLEQRAERVGQWLSRRSANRCRNLRIELERGEQLEEGETYAPVPLGLRQPLWGYAAVAVVDDEVIDEFEGRKRAEQYGTLVRQLDAADAKAKRDYLRRQV